MASLRANWVLGISTGFGAMLFAWPVLTPLLPDAIQSSIPWIVLALAPVAVLVILMALNRDLFSSKELAMLGTLAAFGAAIRFVTSGVAGFEAVFVLIILAGRAYGPRFGFLLGLLTILSSSIFFGGLGPWTAFQMLAVGWVGLGAGLLPKGTGKEKWLLVAYAVISSYIFGLIMNLWFWPIAVGLGTSISYSPEAPVIENLIRFLTFSLTSSTLTWDTVRAVTVSFAIAYFGPAILSTLRRAKLRS